jgi:hypothetical protein
MVRRLIKANQMIDECDNALDQLRHRLEQITTPAPAGGFARAPVDFAPPTSGG